MKGSPDGAGGGHELLGDHNRKHLCSAAGDGYRKADGRRRTQNKGTHPELLEPFDNLLLSNLYGTGRRRPGDERSLRPDRDNRNTFSDTDLLDTEHPDLYSYLPLTEYYSTGWRAKQGAREASAPHGDHELYGITLKGELYHTGRREHDKPTNSGSVHNKYDLYGNLLNGAQYRTGWRANERARKSSDNGGGEPSDTFLRGESYNSRDQCELYGNLLYDEYYDTGRRRAQCEWKRGLPPGDRGHQPGWNEHDYHDGHVETSLCPTI